MERGSLKELRSAGVDTTVREFGIPQEFLPHGGRAELLEEIGLTPQNIARYAVEAIVGADEALEQTTHARQVAVSVGRD